MIAALFVQSKGCYFNDPRIDPWDETRDARLYSGPYPVICHSPCARWSRYWSGGPSAKVKRKLGDDDGCFAAALSSVRKFGGVLEHPEASHAWKRFGIPKPPRNGGWIEAPFGFTCCVEQGHYGHEARKMTWLYYVGYPPPPLVWGKSIATRRLDAGFHSAEERRRAVRTGACQRLSARQRSATPLPFKELLIWLVQRSQFFQFWRSFAR